MATAKHFFALICCVLFAAALQAQATLSIQGVLKKSNGSSVDDGDFSLTFKLYTVSTGGSAVWSETQPTVPVTGGVYSALLGSVNPLTAAFDVPYYLGVTVGSGAELQPRTQLTSSPYALSLVGTGNVFPSSGTVMVGGTNPNHDFQLHVQNSSGWGRLLLAGSTGAQINFLKGGNTAELGWGTSDYTFRLNPGSNNTSFQYGGVEKLHVDNGGIVVSGGCTVSNGLTVNGGSAFTGGIGVNGSGYFFNGLTIYNGLSTSSGGFSTQSISASGTINASGGDGYSGTYGYLNSSGNTGSINNSGSYSINATNRVKASEFDAYSDRRIKKDLVPADNRSDLEILKSLRVTNYRHVDEVANGSAYKKGFIAQEVETVFPEAVTKTSDFIPNIYEKAVSFSLSGDKMTVVLAKNHDLKAGDAVKMIFPDGKKEFTVAAVSADNVFTLSGWTGAKPEWVFAYGKKVDDFRQVDYDRIHTLNVSATQELIRRVEQLEKENANLKTENGGLKASIEGMDTRLRKLEAAASN